jgi:hypothetical protein
MQHYREEYTEPMSDGMNKLFLADPVAFAKRSPLSPQGNLKGTLKNKGNDFHSVASDERVVFCDILKPGKVTGYPAETYLLNLSIPADKFHSSIFSSVSAGGRNEGSRTDSGLLG